MGKLYDMLKKDVRYHESLKACINCGTCSAICPAASFYKYDPLEIIETVQCQDENQLEELLKSAPEPMYFDQLELAVGKMRDLWPGDHTFVQHARLVYDLLWQFDREGRLTREMRIQPTKMGDRHRWYFGLKD